VKRSVHIFPFFQQQQQHHQQHQQQKYMNGEKESFSSQKKWK